MGFRSVVFNMVARIYYTVLLIFFFGVLFTNTGVSICCYGLLYV